MKKLFLVILCVLPLAAQSPKKTESFWSRLLRVTGVSATPASLRGEDRATGGDIWLVMVTQKPTPQRLTRGEEYTSPVFDYRGQSVLALRSSGLYRVPISGETPIRLHTLMGVTKLVGVSRDDADQVLVLAQEAQGPRFAAMLSIQAGTLTRIPHNPASNDDQVMMAHLAGGERVYGDTRLYTEKNEKEGLAGTLEFTDVYLKHASDPAINLTIGNGVSSSQPSLSADAQWVVFIRGQR